MEYLDFELPIKELKEQLEKCYEIGVDSDVDVIATCKKIEKKLEKTKKEIYKNLTPWQRVQLSRHPSRPYTLDYINALTEGDFFGEMALLGEQVRMANVIADKPTTLLRLNKRHVISMASIEPELKNRLERAIKKRKS